MLSDDDEQEGFTELVVVEVECEFMARAEEQISLREFASFLLKSTGQGSVNNMAVPICLVENSESSTCENATTSGCCVCCLSCMSQAPFLFMQDNPKGNTNRQGLKRLDHRSRNA